MKYVLTESAPKELGPAGAVVELTRSQAAYARLRGHVRVAAAAVPDNVGTDVKATTKAHRPRARKTRR